MNHSLTKTCGSYPTTVAFFVALTHHMQTRPAQDSWHRVVICGYKEADRKKHEKQAVLLSLEIDPIEQRYPLFAWVKRDTPDADNLGMYRITTTQQ